MECNKRHGRRGIDGRTNPFRLRARRVGVRVRGAIKLQYPVCKHSLERPPPRRSVVSPMHFRISAYLQNRTCLQGTPLTFPPQVLHALHCNFRRHTARLCIYIPLQSTARRPQHFCKFINRPCSFRVAGADAAIVSSSCPSLSRSLMRVECSQLIPPTTRTHVFFESVDAMGWDDDSECEVAANPLHVNILLTHTRI